MIPCALGVDVGTTHLKLLALTRDEEVLGPVRRPTPELHWHGVVAHDPEAILAELAGMAHELGRLAPEIQVVGVAVASMAEEGVLLDARGRVLAPAPAWFSPLPSRGLAAFCDAEGASRFYGVSGLRNPRVSSLAHWLGLVEAFPDLFAAADRFLSMDAFVAHRLGGEAALARSQASRTGAWDVLGEHWDPWTLEQVGKTGRFLPPVRPTGARLGSLRPGALPLPSDPRAAVAVGGHDHALGALGVGVTTPGAVLDSMGTAESLLRPVNLSALPDRALDLAVNASAGGTRHVAMVGLPTGRALRLLGEAWGIAHLADLPWAEALARPAPAMTLDFGSVAGEGLPSALGRLGLTSAPDPAILAAVVHGMAEVARQRLEALASLDAAPFRVWAIGGAAAIPGHMDLRRRVLGRPVTVAPGSEHVALGAAKAAWAGVDPQVGQPAPA